MSRLTEKNNRIVLISNYSQTPSKEKIAEANRYNKLAALEDLEEQLGCPLEVLFKALIQEIWYEGNKGYLYHMRGNELKFLNGWCITNELHYANTKDYKKTWWLREDKSE